MNKKLIEYGLASALGEAVYILLVALFMRYASHFTGPDTNIIGGVVFLMLFVLSAAVSGALIVGKPVLLYLEGEKKEAVKLFGITLGWIFVLFIVFLIALIF